MEIFTQVPILHYSNEILASAKVDVFVDLSDRTVKFIFIVPPEYLPELHQSQLVPEVGNPNWKIVNDVVREYVTKAIYQIIIEG